MQLYSILYDKYNVYKCQMQDDKIETIQETLTFRRFFQTLDLALNTHVLPFERGSFKSATEHYKFS